MKVISMRESERETNDTITTYIVWQTSGATQGVEQTEKQHGARFFLNATLSQTQDKMTGDITSRILMSIVLLDYHYCLFFHYILSMNSIIIILYAFGTEKTFSATFNCQHVD